jgi:hypothetical protein
VLALLLLVALALSACRSAEDTTRSGTPVSAAPTSPLMPTVIPSVTPLGAPGGASVYGSVQSNQVGQTVDAGATVVGAPLFFSAQSSVDVVVQPGMTTMPLVATVTPAPTLVTVPEGVITIPPVQDDGPVFEIINSLCIPLLNFVLNATLGIVVWAWQTVGGQGGLLAQTLLCILPPIALGWYFLFFRRRRRRRGG